MPRGERKHTRPPTPVKARSPRLPSGSSRRWMATASRLWSRSTTVRAVPAGDSFAREAIDFDFFPESYVSASDRECSESLTKLVAELRAPPLVGAADKALLLRLCIINHSTGWDDVRGTLEAMERFGSDALAA